MITIYVFTARPYEISDASFNPVSGNFVKFNEDQSLFLDEIIVNGAVMEATEDTETKIRGLAQYYSDQRDREKFRLLAAYVRAAHVGNDRKDVAVYIQRG